MSAFPWVEQSPTPGTVTRGLLERPVLQVARDLLGCRLISTIGGQTTSGVIVEVEAYAGVDDPASHAATKSGRTERNAVMFGPAGYAYVYKSYGVHWCMNVVTGCEDEPQAVLIRGLEPLGGVDVMQARRHDRIPLAAGPGRVGEAMGITGALYGHDLARPPLQLLAGWSLPDDLIEVSGRIGVSAAADWPNRFYVRGSAGVSHR